MGHRPTSVDPFKEINCHKKWLDGDKRKSNRGMREKSNTDSWTGDEDARCIETVPAHNSFLLNYPWTEM